MSGNQRDWAQVAKAVDGVYAKELGPDETDKPKVEIVVDPITHVREQIMRAGHAYLEAMRPLIGSIASIGPTVELAYQAGVAHKAIEAAKAQENQNKRIEALAMLAGVNTTELVDIMNDYRRPTGEVNFYAVESCIEAMITPEGPVIKRMATQLVSGELAEDTIVDINAFMAGVLHPKPTGKARAMLLRQLGWAVEDGDTALEAHLRERLEGETNAG